MQSPLASNTIFSATEKGLRLDGQAVVAQAIEHAHGLAHDFGADAVTGEQRDLHVIRPVSGEPGLLG